MKKFILTLIFSLLLVTPVFADAQTPPETSEDKIKIVKPADREMINGAYNVSWYSLSSNQINSIKLIISKGNCDTTGVYIGDIYLKEKDFNASKNEFKIRWDTTEPLLNAASLENGDYCLAALMLSGTGSSVTIEDKINITIDNSKNRTPFILNSVTTLFIKPNENFALDIDAADFEGGKLTYELERAPAFLTIDPNSGVISSKSAPEGGIHTVSVIVKDEQGAKDNEVFTLNVTQQSDQFKTLLELISPNLLTIYNSNQALIEWTFRDDSMPLTLQFSSDGINWEEITKVDETQKNYLWDIAGVDNGDYYIRLVPTDNSATLFGLMSHKFTIAKFDSDITVNLPVLVEVKPEANSRIDTDISEISGKFLIPQGKSLQKLEIKVNDTIVLNNCAVDNLSFKCTLSTPITDGNNKYSVTIEDSSGGSITEEIQFTIAKNQQPVTGFAFNPMVCVILLVFIGLIVGVVVVLPKILKSLPKPGSKKVTSTGYTDQITVSNEDVKLKGDEFTFTDTASEPANFEIGSQVIEDNAQPVPTQPVKQEESTVDILTQDIREPSLPSSYTSQEEIPDWLKDNDSSDPVGVSKEDLQGSKPLEGTQPHGLESYNKDD